MTSRPTAVRSDPGAPSEDPHRELLYGAESDAAPGGGRSFRRFVDVQDFVLRAMQDPWWEDRFPDAPVEVDVLRRSRTATFSAAHVSEDGWDGVIWIRDGSWNAVTVVHELAHVGIHTRSGRNGVWAVAHGPDFCGALLDLWRRHLGLHAYGALRLALDDRGVPYHRDRRPGGSARV